MNVKITQLTQIAGQPYMTIPDMTALLGVSRRTVCSRRQELEKEKERYGEAAVIKDGGIVLVNYLCMLDYLKYRERLREKNLRKTVPPFNAKKWADAMGWYGEQEVV